MPAGSRARTNEGMEPEKFGPSTGSTLSGRFLLAYLSIQWIVLSHCVRFNPSVGFSAITKISIPQWKRAFPESGTPGATSLQVLSPTPDIAFRNSSKPGQASSLADSWDSAFRSGALPDSAPALFHGSHDES